MALTRMSPTMRNQLIIVATGLLLAGCPDALTSSASGDSSNGAGDTNSLPDSTSGLDAATDPDAVPEDAVPEDAVLSDAAGQDSGGPDVLVGEDSGPMPDTDVPDSSGGETPNLVINEIMYNPKESGNEDGEWVEIYNPGSAPVDLNGWTLKDKGSNNHVIGSSVVVEPGGYIVLGRNGTSSANGGYTADYVYENFFLANGGDSVVLLDASGKEIDQLSYKTESPWPDQLWGVSLELQDASFDNALAASWMAACAPFGDGDLGTPGQPNGKPPVLFDLIAGNHDWQAPSLPASLYFSPYDNLEDRVIDELKTAQTSVTMAFFNIRLIQVLWALEDLVADGVVVDVVLDAKQQAQDFNTMGEKLLAKGISVTLVDNTSAAESTMHQKFTVIDGQRVITGSANYSSTALNVSDEDLLIIDSADLAARFELEFIELKTGADDVDSLPYTGSPSVQAFMGPEDNLDDRVLALIAGATTSVHVAMFQLNSSELVDALIDAHDSGINTVVILDQKFLAAGGAELDLATAGVPLVLASNTATEFAEMHSKLMIVDNEIVAMGSYNWTNLASFHNDEGLLIIDEPELVVRAAGKFAQMITDYHPGSPSLLGLSEGDRTITFNVGNISLKDNAILNIKMTKNDIIWGVQLMNNTLTTTASSGTRIDYNYRVQSGNSIVFEGGHEHVFVVPFAAGPFVVNDAFRP
ncbi:MAG: phosphatidylserine/phosphatidylglycerophosphate/cardiolipin synthase-like enzyme [Myxococcota bacterium]|jgi:phosphatidylserine/phosphatidylglycerophosphate/cardiolipin synthase-like enzyme